MTPSRTRSLMVLLVMLMALLLTASPAPSPARAAPSLRTQVNQRGDFALIGNTFGHECAAGTPAPVAGVVGDCGAGTADSSPDVYWRSDSPNPGEAEANTSIAMTQARSTAVLKLPPGRWLGVATKPANKAGISLEGPGPSKEIPDHISSSETGVSEQRIQQETATVW